MTTETTIITVKQRLDSLGVEYAAHDLSRIRLRVYRAWLEQYPEIRLEKVQQQEGRQYFSATAYPVSFAPEIDKIADAYFDEQLAALLEANRKRLEELEKLEKQKATKNSRWWW